MQKNKLKNHMLDLKPKQYYYFINRLLSKTPLGQNTLAQNGNFWDYIQIMY